MTEGSKAAERGTATNAGSPPELNMVTASETDVATAPAREATQLPEPQEAPPSQVPAGTASNTLVLGRRYHRRLPAPY
jgi:hypothetical protein